MRKIIFKNLPQNCYFWREGDPYKYLKCDINNVLYLSGNVREQFVKTVDSNEFVLLTPTMCDNCFSDLKGWPPELKCSTCGNVNEERKDFDKLRQMVAQWTANPNPAL